MKQWLKKTYRGIEKWLYFYIHALTTSISYAIARLVFPAERRKGTRLLNEITVIKVGDPDATFRLSLPSNFKTLLDQLYREALARMEDASNCVLRSGDDAITAELIKKIRPGMRTADLPEIKGKLVGIIKLRKALDLPGLTELCGFILPQIEERVYHSAIIVEKATVYRHTESVVPEVAAIKWHSDNHFLGVTKLMFYLNDVTAHNAPFEYLRKVGTHEPIIVPPAMPQLYPKGRIPLSVIERKLREGYECCKVFGPAGTALFFNDKIMHKGNYAEHGFRDVLVLQLKPVISNRGRFIGPWSS